MTTLINPCLRCRSFTCPLWHGQKCKPKADYQRAQRNAARRKKTERGLGDE